MAAERTRKCCQRSLKSNSGFAFRLAAGGQVGGDSEAHKLRGDEGATDDEIDAAATQWNCAQEAASVFACGGGHVWHDPLLIVSMQKVDVTAHGVGASGGCIQFVGVEFIRFEVRPYIAF